ncbi:MAG: single-stranded-DNA-specific exonuclease RecJ [Lewinellaceae bacterium]|nr:single-stranded-DNA-specific exonuclease RecJ [Lewinellaceae bacterium]
MKRPQWRKIPADTATVQQLRNDLSLDPLFCQLLVQRGIVHAEEAEKFLSPSLEALHDPYIMRDMDKAVDRIEQAIHQGEHILLYGDYDVDGTTSVALMYAFLSGYTRDLDYYLPDRDKEGYGVSMEGVDYAKSTGCSLLITIDCGIKAHAAIAYAATLGIDVIVCDHHVPEGDLPDAVANLDPKREDCPYPFKELSGCGIAFKLAQAVASRNNVRASDLVYLLDLVVVSIACDIVPMIGENRTLAHFGMQRFNQEPRVGLWALVQRSGRHYPLNINDLVFGIGPLINAAGRLGDARDAVKLLLSADKKSALENAGALVTRNNQRREVDFATTEAAKLRFMDQEGWQERKSIVLFDPEWHLGIIGIAASRMAESFHRPSVVLTQTEGRVVGSARSVPGFDLYDALQQCEDMFYSFGGHAHAAGMQMSAENVPAFRDKFESLVQLNLPKESEMPILDICADLPLNRITPELWRTLKRFSPFGPHNMHPVFIARNVVDSGRSRLLDNNHVRFSICEKGSSKIWTGIGFGIAEAFKQVRHRPFDLAFTIQEGNWRGERVLSLMVKDVC